MKAKDIFVKIGKGLKEAAPTIGLTAGAIILSVGYVLVCEKLGIPVEGSSRYDNRSYEPKPQIFPGAMGFFMMPRNTAESKIIALRSDAMNVFFDSDRCRIAKDIYEIATESGDESTKQFAINVLQDISHNMAFSSGRATISELIKEV